MDSKYERMIPELANIAEAEDRTRNNRAFQETQINIEAIILARLFRGALDVISPEDKEAFCIRSFIPQNGLRNALARRSLNPDNLTTDELDYLSSARGITRWLYNRMLDE